VEYVKAYSQPPSEPLQIPEGTTKAEIADEARDAALSFLEGVRTGWDKLDLALWLTGPYARATKWLARGERVAGLDDEEEISHETIDELLVATRDDVVAALETAIASSGVLDFAEETLAKGHLRRGIDADGDDVYVPVDLARLRLRDRIKSLLAADYLNDPSSYIELYVCKHCQAVVFDHGAKQLGVCAAHRISGFIGPAGAGTEGEAAGG
jgi:hypothetical protein